MVRKTREEALATREELLDAAERVFRKHGVGHTSLAEVADAAGVTRGAIYWHFKDKADLFQALVKRVEMPMNAAMEEMDRTSAADPLGAVRQLAIHALQNLAGSARTQAVFEVVFLRCEYTQELAPVRARQLEDRKVCLRRCEAAFEQAIARRQLNAKLGRDAHPLRSRRACAHADRLVSRGIEGRAATPRCAQAGRQGNAAQAGRVANRPIPPFKAASSARAKRTTPR